MRFGRRGVWVALPLLLVLSFPRLPARAARGCVPFADAIVAWDVDADLYVVASYHERATPPRGSAAFPNLLELRRITSGKQLAVVNCAVAPGGLGASAARTPCDFRSVFGRLIPKTAAFVATGPPLSPGQLRVATTAEPSGDKGFALLARSPAGRPHRVRWLGQSATASGERLSIRLGRSERRADAIVVALESRYRGGDCDRTEVRLLRLDPRDLSDEAGPQRQQRLLAKLTLSSSVDDWRTAADLAPLPPDKLIFGMVAAADAGRPDLAARWWTEGTADLPLDRVASLATALRTRPELTIVRQLITLPPEH
ncbi:MAG TPA: hypothetical protein VGF45_24295 [Polyangia bacterium]